MARCLEVDNSFENKPAVLLDAVAIAHGEAAVAAFGGNANAMDGLRSIFRHCKPLLAIGFRCHGAAARGPARR